MLAISILSIMAFTSLLILMNAIIFVPNRSVFNGDKQQETILRILQKCIYCQMCHAGMISGKKPCLWLISLKKCGILYKK